MEHAIYMRCFYSGPPLLATDPCSFLWFWSPDGSAHKKSKLKH